MALRTISGIDNTKNETVDVDQDKAAESFIRFVNKNYFGLKDLLKKYPNITNTMVKNYCDMHGVDFNIIKTILDE